MKPFSIVITGASRPELWYADKVGRVFEVNGARWNALHGLELETDGWGFVLWADCELAPQPEAAELALLRRVAEAADVFFNEISDSDVYLKIIQASSWEELHDVMAAWKAGQK